MQETNNQDCLYRREYWTGQSRDGILVDGDGYHYFKMNQDGQILQAFEYYEALDGEQISSTLPEFENVNWFQDLGYEDLEPLEDVTLNEFEMIRKLVK